MDQESNEPFDAATTVEHSPEARNQVRPLLIPSKMRDAIVAHLHTWLPNEGCGLLAGIHLDSIDVAVRFYPGTNVDRSPVRYTMEPREVIDALVEMRKLSDQGWFLAGIVHSHPRTSPTPSRTDLAEAYYPDARLLIISFAAPEPELCGWALSRDRETRVYQRAPLLIGKI